jgi:hypothetical protein
VPGLNDPHIQNRPGHAMHKKDNFMRFAVIASVIVVGALALAVRLNT